MSADRLHSETRVWQRYSVSQRVLRFFFYFLFVAVVVQSIRQVEIIPNFCLMPQSKWPTYSGECGPLTGNIIHPVSILPCLRQSTSPRLEPLLPLP